MLQIKRKAKERRWIEKSKKERDHEGDIHSGECNQAGEEEKGGQAGRQLSLVKGLCEREDPSSIPKTHVKSQHGAIHF